jgi:hypothetical protein
MVKRKCPKCEAEFYKKSHYDRHMNRIYDCCKKNKKSNTNNNLEKLTENNKNSQNLTENSQNFTKINKNSQNLTELDLDSNILKTDFTNLKPTVLCTSNPVVSLSLKDIDDYLNIDETTFCCSFCNKKLINKYSLLRHINESCKVKKADDQEKENTFKMLLERDKQRENEINELKKQNKLFEEQNKILMDKIDKLINMKSSSKSSKTINNNQKITNNNQKITNTQNNTQNNFVMVNFGKEDLKIIDEREFIDRVVKQNKISGVKIPDEVLKIIHFNPKYPQLSNIYISDINREKCMVYEDGEWKLSNIDNVPQVMDKICLFSKDQIEILREKYPNNKPLNDRLNTIEKYNNKIDEEYIQDLREDDNYNDVKILIKDAEEFQKYTYSTIKKTLYNEGKKIKKNIKLK